MVNIIVFSTLIGSLISGFLGRYIGILWSRIIVCSSVIISLIATYILYYDVMVLDYEYRNIIMSWISVDFLNIDWGFLIDKVSVSVLIPVVTISSLVHIYAVVYMSHDPHQQRFFSYLSFFTFGMIVLVTGDNLLILFLGWELIGVASYLLISFWFTRISAGKSGLNSLLLNRFGDTFFVIGLGLTVYLVGSLNFDTLFSLNGYLSTDMLTLILICMLIGCASKSVQFGLHTWLLNSMEGPTPVSSLLHAACLVIAGVYLLVRCSYIVEYSPIALILILVLGGITTLVSGLIAVVSNDIKKIIALSTMSQLARKYNLSLILSNIWNQTIFKKVLEKKNILINKNLSILEKEKIGSIDLNNNHNNNNLKNLDPNYITVFRDAEGCFFITIWKQKNFKSGYSVSLGFKIDSHIRDSKLLEEIKYLNGLGHIYRRENVRQYSTLNKKSMDVLIDLEEKRWNEWLAGLIDGKGTFVISKKGYANFKLIVSEKDIYLINEIKQKLGGSIKEISGSKALKYKLHNKKSFIKLINKINGLLKNPIKILQLNRVCVLYNIELKSIVPLTYNNGWLSGYFDGNGSIYYDEKLDQIILSITSKNKFLLDPLNKLYMGRIKITNEKDSFQYIIYRKKEVLDLIDNYFKRYPLKSSKRLKLNLINDFYFYKNQVSASTECGAEGKKREWIELKNKWDKL